MKGKIDSDGGLWIERAGQLREQLCPRQQDHHSEYESDPASIACGDWCPLFGEPVVDSISENMIRITLSCSCKIVTFRFDDLTDDRKEIDSGKV